MILVDTSVWIDHLHRAEPHLVKLLGDDLGVVHDGVIQELALGSIAQRTTVLSLLGNLRRTPLLSHDEVLAFVERNRLWGRGLSAIDAQLLGAARIARLTLWTRDKRLRTAATDLQIKVFEE